MVAGIVVRQSKERESAERGRWSKQVFGESGTDTRGLWPQSAQGRAHDAAHTQKEAYSVLAVLQSKVVREVSKGKKKEEKMRKERQRGERVMSLGAAFPEKNSNCY